ncbi:MAG TPA: metalloregulator ArsR/SmtB family transcription factor, partial [Vicinamibacterales bacterium]|nr:metalloregulator ArsR/SmtB family transcription factor [Vicinamibacterales bacterium]
LPLTPVGACCTPVTKDVLSLADAEAMAVAFKALSDPTRLRLLSIVAASDGDEACVCDLTEPIGLSQPTVSHHLKILMDAGYLTRSKRGTWAYYKLVPGSLDRVSALLATAAA